MRGTKILKLIKRPDCLLDGVHLQYNVDYLGPKRAALDRLTAQCDVGMWGVEPDNIAAVEALVEAGVSFVNTDLPKTFLDRVKLGVPAV